MHHTTCFYNKLTYMATHGCSNVNGLQWYKLKWSGHVWLSTAINVQACVNLGDLRTAPGGGGRIQACGILGALWTAPGGGGRIQACGILGALWTAPGGGGRIQACGILGALWTAPGGGGRIQACGILGALWTAPGIGGGCGLENTAQHRPKHARHNPRETEHEVTQHHTQIWGDTPLTRPLATACLW